MRSAFISFVLSFVYFALPASAQCPSGTLEKQFEERRKSVQPVQVEPKEMEATFVTAHFDAAAFSATTFSCGTKRKESYPAFTAYSWLIELPQEFTGRVFDIRRELNRIIESDPENLEVSGNTLFNYDTEEEQYITPTIDFYLYNKELLDPKGKVRLILSGPYWRQEEFGENAMGLLQTPGGKVKTDEGERGKAEQDYQYFSAKHVLCFTKTGVEMFDWNVYAIKAKYDPTASKSQKTKLKKQIGKAMQKQAEEECESAFQAGPAFWDRKTEEGSAIPGISGLSLQAGPRNLLFRIRNGEESRTFIVSTISALSPFDIMVYIDALKDAIDPDAEISWAIGVQGEEYLSGPVFVDGDRVSRLTLTNRITGALLVIE